MTAQSCWWSVGSGGTGCLALGNFEDYSEFQPLHKSVRSAQQIASSGVHTLFILPNQTLWTCGQNTERQLGEETSENDYECIPKQIPHLDKIVKVNCGWEHSFAKNEAGVIFAWGSNKHGQLGIGDHAAGTIVPKPQEVPLSTSIDIHDFCGGFNHSLFLSTQGDIYGCGNNRFLQTGQPREAGNKIHTPEVISLDSVGKPSSVRCGWHHSLCLTERGEVITWGKNNGGQLAHSDEERSALPKKSVTSDGSPIDNVAKVEAGWHHIIILRNNEILGWGRSFHGQLGFKGEARHPVKIPIPVHGSEHDHIIDIISGAEHCLAITASRRLFVWGWNEHGNLGTKDQEDRLTPEEIAWSRGITQKCVSAGAAVFVETVDAKAMEGNWRTSAERNALPCRRKV